MIEITLLRENDEWFCEGALYNSFPRYKDISLLLSAIELAAAKARKSVKIIIEFKQ